MLDKKEQKNASIYICNICNFSSSKKSNYNKHLLTAKHKMLENAGKKMPKNANVFKCDCGKEYKHNQSYYRHKKNCTKENNYITNQENQEEKHYMMKIISQNKEIMDALVLQNEELQRQNKEQSDTIKELIPKIGNNNNNNTINNHFNIQNFLYEDCKDAINFSEFIDNIKISFEDLEQQSQIGFIKGISKLFIENLQELGTYKRPIHCTDKKRKTLYIKENNEWDKEGSQDKLKKGINILSIKSQETLLQEKQENQEEYNDIESEFSQKCISIQRNLYPDNPRETAINKVIENITQSSTIME